MPARVAWGARTRPFFGVVSRAAAPCVTGRHAAVAGAAHMSPEERPREFAVLVEWFIGSLQAER